MHAQTYGVSLVWNMRVRHSEKAVHACRASSKKGPALGKGPALRLLMRG